MSGWVWAGGAAALLYYLAKRSDSGAATSSQAVTAPGQASPPLIATKSPPIMAPRGGVPYEEDDIAAIAAWAPTWGGYVPRRGGCRCHGKRGGR